MAIAKKEEVGITLPPIDIKLMEVTVIGDSPLIVHAWSQKAKLEMLGKQMKQAKGAKEAKNPKADFESSLYRLADGAMASPQSASKLQPSPHALPSLAYPRHRYRWFRPYHGSREFPS